MFKQENSKRVAVYWEADINDGSCIKESDNVLWSSIKENVVGLRLKSDDTVLINLPSGMGKYTQGKTGSCGLFGGEIKIESRWIGFENNSTGVKIRRSENDGRIDVEV